MLGNTGYSLAQISELMGFSSPSYFSQCFRKAEGLSLIHIWKLNKMMVMMEGFAMGKMIRVMVEK